MPIFSLILYTSGCVDNVQILPRSPYLDGQRSKTSLPVLGTFKRSLHSFGEASDTTHQAQGAGCVPTRIFNSNLCVSYFMNVVLDPIRGPVWLLHAHVWQTSSSLRTSST